MKVLDQLLRPLKKLSKGILVLFTINLVVILSLFIFESCKKGGYYAKTTNTNIEAKLANFRNAMKTAAFDLNTRTIARSVNEETQLDPNSPTAPVTPGYMITLEDYAFRYVESTEIAALALNILLWYHINGVIQCVRKPDYH